jgi:hypothetical protein
MRPGWAGGWHRPWLLSPRSFGWCRRPLSRLLSRGSSPCRKTGCCRTSALAAVPPTRLLSQSPVREFGGSPDMWQDFATAGAALRHQPPQQQHWLLSHGRAPRQQPNAHCTSGFGPKTVLRKSTHSAGCPNDRIHQRGEHLIGRSSIRPSAIGEQSLAASVVAAPGEAAIPL